MLNGILKWSGNFIRDRMKIANYAVQDTAYGGGDGLKSALMPLTRMQVIPKPIRYVSVVAVAALMGGMMIATTHEGKKALGVADSAPGNPKILGKVITGGGFFADMTDAHAHAIKLFMGASFGAALLSTASPARNKKLTGPFWEKVNNTLRKIGMDDNEDQGLAPNEIRLSKVGSLMAAILGIAAGVAQAVPELFVSPPTPEQEASAKKAFAEKQATEKANVDQNKGKPATTEKPAVAPPNAVPTAA